MRLRRRRQILPLTLSAIVCALTIPVVRTAEEPENKTVSLRSEFRPSREPQALEPRLSIATPHAPGPGVGPNLRIIRNPGCQDSEIGIGASRDGRTLAVAANGDFVVASQDGGANWSAPTGWPAGGGSTQGDPSIGVGQTGNVYLTYIWNNPAPSCDFGLSISTDQGMNFPAPVSAVSCPPSAGGCFPDQETIAVDQINPGPGGADQLYLAWRQFTNVGCPNPASGNTDASIACSANSGAAGSWTAPVLVDASGDRARPAVAPDGSVYVVYVDGGNGGAVRVHRFTSCQGGLVPIPGYPYTVAGSSSVTGVPFLDRQGQEGNPMIGVDPYNSGLVYVVYEVDTSGDTSGDPGVFLRISNDAGQNWSGAIKINDNVTNNTSRYFPWLAVNPADGSVLLAWYDRRDDPINNDLTAYFGARVTGGGTGSVTVSPNFRISEVDYMASNPGPTCGSPIYGDYNNVAAGPQFMYASWASPVSPPSIQPPSGDVDVFFAAIVAGDIPQIQPSGLLDFDDVCVGEDAILDLTICNSGNTDLVVNSITSSDPQFAVVSATFPLVISPDACFPVQVRYTPSGTGDASAMISIQSNDPVNPTVTVQATGSGTEQDINVAIADSGNFGAVCKGLHSDLDLTLFNQGDCDLTISNIQLLPDAGWFQLPDDLDLPLVLSPDAEFTLPLRFAPNVCFDTLQSRTIRITSDDPDEGIVEVDVRGVSPCPNLVIDHDLTGTDAFPATVVDTDGLLGCYSEGTVDLRNNGACPLTITSIGATGADFLVTDPTLFPIVLPTGEETLAVTVRFVPQGDADPLAPGEIVGQLTVASDDPDGNGTADLCGESVAQSGVRILVTDQSGAFPTAVDEVDDLRIKSSGQNRPGPINLRFTDQPVSSTLVCMNRVDYHVDQETLPATGTTGSDPNSSYTASAKEGNLQTTQSFGLGQCEFREFQLQLEDSASPVCLLAPKGAACSTDGECCSGKCRGPAGNMTCK